MHKNIALDYVNHHREAILKDYFDFLRIPSVGADPKRLGDCARAAAWVKQYLKPLGFDVEIMTPKKGLPVPIVVAERPSSQSMRTVLFYGHYDVQPEDPLNEWKTPPFEPTLIDNRVYARGAQDDKGQMFSFLVGVKALIESGATLPTLRIVLDGQEESGSETLSRLAPHLHERLSADVIMVSDTGCGPDNRPAIVAGLRGVQHFTVNLSGPGYDLHSGHHGGIAPNPALGLARLLATLHNPDGSIAVEGFCDHIAMPSQEELARAEEGDITDEAYEKEIGCPPAGGQHGKSKVMRGSFLPTIEVNGVHSGYGGPGSKTVIPSTAFAKLSTRLVPGQKPAETFAAIQKHLEAHCPAGMKVWISEACRGAPGFRLAVNSPVFRLAEEVLLEMDPRGPVYQWEGASIPIIATLREISGAAPLLVGWGREEDKIHCPNESFGLDQFQSGVTYAMLMLHALA